MKTRTLSFCILAVLAAGCTQANATEHSILVPVWEKVLAHDGNGEWDYRVMRWVRGEPADGIPRLGQAVDNRGRIYLCDSHNDRLLVFSPDGERLSIINVKERLAFPTDIWVDEADNLYLYVLGQTPGGNLGGQIILKSAASGWDIGIVPVDSNACAKTPDAQGSEFWDRQIVPLGSGGLRVMPVFVEGKPKYQMLDKGGKSVGFAPSRYRDQKGRFYEIVKNSGELQVFNNAGEFASQIKMSDSPANLVPYRGWIYVYARNALYRFAEDGTVEEEIKPILQKSLGWPILASPFADHFYTYQILENEKEKVETFTVKKWEYRKAPSGSEEGATEEDQ